MKLIISITLSCLVLLGCNSSNDETSIPPPKDKSTAVTKDKVPIAPIPKKKSSTEFQKWLENDPSSWLLDLSVETPDPNVSEGRSGQTEIILLEDNEQNALMVVHLGDRSDSVQILDFQMKGNIMGFHVSGMFMMNNMPTNVILELDYENELKERAIVQGYAFQTETVFISKNTK